MHRRHVRIAVDAPDAGTSDDISRGGVRPEAMGAAVSSLLLMLMLLARLRPHLRGSDATSLQDSLGLPLQLRSTGPMPDRYLLKQSKPISKMIWSYHERKFYEEKWIRCKKHKQKKNYLLHSRRGLA